jgi:hypothetical protein
MLESLQNRPKTAGGQKVDKRWTEGGQMVDKRWTEGRQNPLISGTKSDLRRSLRDGVLFITDCKSAQCPYRHMRTGAH